MQYLEFLKRKQISIALIQEIHRNPMAFIDFRIGCVAYSSSVARSKGVAIIFNSQLAVSIDSSGKADAGRLAYIVLKSTVQKYVLPFVLSMTQSSLLWFLISF